MSTYTQIPALILATLLAPCSWGEDDAPDSGRFAVDDYELAYLCAGEGSPSIFLETPSGLTAEESFSSVFDGMGAMSRVCRFDRLGMGNSDPVPEGLDQTVSDYSRELGALIARVAPDDGVVLVGYSFGGFVARYYAAHHPEQVEGLLLLDAAHEDWIREMKAQMSTEDWQKMQDILDWFAANLGHNYWDSQLEMDAAPELPASLPIRIISRGLDFQRIRLAEISEEGFRIYNDLHNKYQEAQESLSEETTRVIATGSEHFIPETEPELVLEQLGILLSKIGAAQ